MTGSNKKCLYAGLLPAPENIENSLNEHGIDLVKAIGQITSADQLISLIRDADGVLAGGEPYTANVIQSAPKLRIIARAGVGYDKVDVETATKNGVYVTITPIPELSYAIAEQAMALILAHMKGIPEMNQEMREGVWNSMSWWEKIGDLYDSTLGLLGIGRIGSEVAKRARTFGMHVIYYDIIRRTDLELAFGIEFVSFDGLLERSDILSIHIPLGNETRGIIDEHALRKMKKKAILVNTARGAIVNEADLSRALAEGWIGGAAIDVYSQEPPTPNHPFYRLGSNLPSLIVTEHSISIHTVKAMISAAADEVIRVLTGEQPKYNVNFPNRKLP